MESNLDPGSLLQAVQSGDDLLSTEFLKQDDSSSVTSEVDSSAAASDSSLPGEIFCPIEPQTLAEADLNEYDVEALILKFLHSHGNNMGRTISKQLKLPFGIVQPMLDNLKNQMEVSYKGVAAANDYIYELTDDGHEKAKRLNEICSYCGAAPVGLDKYIESVKSQTLKKHKLSPKEVQQAFTDLMLSPELVAQLGQAVNSGRCMFLYGESGNGKTSIAVRCIDAYDSGVWIPRTITVGGEIIRIFDPTIHEQMPSRSGDSLLKKSVVDERWVRIKRPKIIVGGEFSFSQLEITRNRMTGVLEAPIQMKSNNGCLVIDDFGRQQVTISELLNRWIIPLENGIDYVRLPNGRKIESPFEQLLIFSTNREPGTLGDDAFSRRIPYKIELHGPNEQSFAKLFSAEAQKRGFVEAPGCAQYLINVLAKNELPLKFCYVNEILKQCSEFCEYHDQDRVLNQTVLDLAIHNYFSGF